MRKYFATLGLLALLIPLVFGGTFQVPTALAQDGNNNKISGLLALQVEAKLRAVDAGGVIEALEEGRVNILQAMGMRVDDLDKQTVFIHLAQEPSQSQIEQLEAIGITLYLDSWIPPVAAHPTGFIIADMPLDKLEALAGKDYVVRLDSAERVLEPQNDLATQKINADDVWNLGYDGSGVKIAVLDSGLDTNHPDIPPPVASKDYSNYPALDDTIANTVTGHGTHVTGSALGRGTNSGGQYKGVAPGADLIFLKIGNDTTSNASMDAMVYAMKAAVDTYNADIITMSYGGWGSYHDGTREDSQAVDYAVSQGAVVFTSAGNKADDDEHYSGTVGATSTTGYIRVNVTGAGYHDSFLVYNLVWYDGLGTHNDLTGQFYDSAYTPINTINDPQTESTRGTEARFSYYGPEPFYFYYLPPGSHTYYLKVKNNSTVPQSFHIYLWYGGKASVKFDSPDPNYTITSPADADSAIAVGGYTTRKNWTNYKGVTYWYTPDQTVNTVVTFSSRGPRVDTGAPQKPNIIAPGSAIISCRDTDVYTWPNPNYDPAIIDNDGLNLNGSGPADYYMMQGTSMASPMAAGAAALLLEAQPGLKGNPAAVRDRLQQTASQASSPDNIWGYGLIDVHQAVADGGQPDITVNPTSFDVTLPQNTTEDYTLAIGNNGDATLTYNISDREATGEGSTAEVESAPILEWDRTFGGGDHDEGYSVQQTSDGGYIIAGCYSYSYGAGRRDVWLIKTDSSGNKIWDRTFGGTVNDEGYSVQQTSDGGYIIAGKTLSFGAGSSDVYLIKTDEDGNEVWSKTFGGVKSDGGYSVRQTSDGGYVIAGNVDGFYTSFGTYYDLYLIKTDENGNEEWNKIFKFLTGSSEKGYSVQQTSDGGYVIASIAGYYWIDKYKFVYDIYLIKTDENGNEVWSKTFGGTDNDVCRSVQQTSDGGYIIAGYTESYGAGSYDVWLIKTDSSGNKIWDRTFGGANYDYGYSVEQTSDGGYIIAGYTYSYGAGSSDVYLIKTDSNGNEQWNKTFGGTNYEMARSVQQTFNGGYIIAGYTESYGAGDADVWLLKLKPETADCPWLDENPKSGSVGPGNLDNITVTINTTGLGSDYSAEIVISSNDPNNAELTVPVTLVVTAPPSVTTNDATNITTNSATLNGNLDGLGAASTVDVSFEWGTTTAYGNTTTPVAKTTTGPFSFNLSGLSPNTTYHFRAKAVGHGTSYDSDKGFTTQADEEFDPWYYDVDDSGVIEKDEAVAALMDYLVAGVITKAQVVEVLILYLGI